MKIGTLFLRRRIVAFWAAVGMAATTHALLWAIANRGPGAPLALAAALVGSAPGWVGLSRGGSLRTWQERVAEAVAWSIGGLYGSLLGGV